MQNEMCYQINHYFQIATGAKGRGVLRLLLVQQQINLLCIPGVCFKFLIIAYPFKNMPILLCSIFEILVMVVTINRTVGDLVVVLGRYVTNQHYITCVQISLELLFQVVLPVSKYLCKKHKRRKFLQMSYMVLYFNIWNNCISVPGRELFQSQ